MIRPILPELPILLPDDTFSFGGLLVFGKLALLIGIAVLFVWRMLKAQRSESVRGHIPACLLLTVSIGLFAFLDFGISLNMVKTLILFGILLYASVGDIQKREVPDVVWIMIGILAFVGFDSANLPSMLIGAAAVFLPQFALAMIRPNKAVGGADIKISTAAAFLLGAEKGIFALIVGLTVAVIVMLILGKAKKIDKSEPFPLVPFLSVGIMAAYLI